MLILGIFACYLALSTIILSIVNFIFSLLFESSQPTIIVTATFYSPYTPFWVCFPGCVHSLSNKNRYTFFAISPIFLPV